MPLIEFGIIWHLLKGDGQISKIVKLKDIRNIVFVKFGILATMIFT